MRISRGLSALCSIIVLAAAVSLAIPAAAVTITVNSANDDPLPTVDGNCTLREAIEAANSHAAVDACPAGANGADTIHFQGNYTITVDQGEMPINEETTIDGTAFTVTLQGISSGTIAFVLNAASSNLALANLTVQDFDSSAGQGGAIRLNNNSAQLSATNVTFKNNNASSGSGGAIWSTGDVTLTDVIFTGNSANNDGGAIYVSGALTVTNGIFGTPVPGDENTAGDSGGAIYAIIPQLSSGGTATFTNCEFYGNQAGASGGEKGGGAIWFDTDATSQVSIVNTAFLNNTATNGAGGAILATFGSNIAYVDPLFPFAFGISRCHFDSNTAGGATTDQDSSGGAIYNRGRMTIVASSFMNNSSTNSSGGAISHNATSDAVLTLANVTLNNNTADTNGGAIANLANTSDVEIINCTIAGNTANAASGGGGIYNANTTAAEFTMTTSIISDNLANGSNDNCAGSAFTDSGFNIQWPDTDCSATITVGDPNLGAAFLNLLPANPLVWVMEIQDVTAAAGAGSNAICGSASAGPIIALDARGVARPSSTGDCDAGAYESDLYPVELQKFTVE